MQVGSGLHQTGLQDFAERTYASLRRFLRMVATASVPNGEDGTLNRY